MLFDAYRYVDINFILRIPLFYRKFSLLEIILCSTCVVHHALLLFKKLDSLKKLLIAKQIN